ncbi:MAG: hypothetical protein PHW04_05025 [Candidatus Wallbacteria bacterium]|nr:hypothetical protein [Candidatus Wallbacteria bacterium]
MNLNLEFGNFNALSLTLVLISAAALFTLLQRKKLSWEYGAVFLLLSFLIFGPQLEFKSPREKEIKRLLLVDNSRSMSYWGESFRKELNGFLKKNELTVIPEKITFDGEQSPILDNLNHFGQGYDEIYLISDGFDNASRSTVPGSYRLFIYQPEERQIKDISVSFETEPDFRLGENRLELAIRDCNYKDTSCEVRVFISGRTLFREEFPLKPGLNLFSRKFTIDQPGKYELSVEIPNLSGEELLDNNRLSCQFDLEKSECRVLLIGTLSDNLTCCLNLLRKLGNLETFLFLTEGKPPNTENIAKKLDPDYSLYFVFLGVPLPDDTVSFLHGEMLKGKGIFFICDGETISWKNDERFPFFFRSFSRNSHKTQISYFDSYYFPVTALENGVNWLSYLPELSGYFELSNPGNGVQILKCGTDPLLIYWDKNGKVAMALSNELFRIARYPFNFSPNDYFLFFFKEFLPVLMGKKEQPFQFYHPERMISGEPCTLGIKPDQPDERILLKGAAAGDSPDVIGLCLKDGLYETEYTTDKSGKYNFSVEFPDSNASWEVEVFVHKSDELRNIGFNREYFARLFSGREVQYFDFSHKFKKEFEKDYLVKKWSLGNSWALYLLIIFLYCSYLIRDFIGERK